MDTAKLKIVYKPLKSLIFAEYNPRQLSEEQGRQLRNSIQRFGLIDPIIVNTHPDRMNIIVGGHMRTRIAEQLGFTEMPCVEVNLDAEKEKECNIRLNKNSGEFDYEKLANFFDVKDLVEFGFTEEELGMGTTGGGETEGDDEVPNEVDVLSITQKGDIYEITTPKSTLRLMCGDSTNIDSVKKLMNGQLAEMAWTDPPYNVDFGSGMQEERQSKTLTHRKIENDNMTREEFEKFIQDAMVSMGTALKEGAMVYVCMSCKELGAVMGVMEKSDYHWSSTIIWKKDRLVLSRKDLHSIYEPIWSGWKNGEARLCPLEDRKQTDVWECDRPTSSDLHPTMKPIALIVRSLENSSKTGNTVVDLFNGSGSTAIACAKTGRNYAGMELDARYVDVSVKRIVEWAKENGVDVSVKLNDAPFDVPRLYTATESPNAPRSKAANN